MFCSWISNVVVIFSFLQLLHISETLVVKHCPDDIEVELRPCNPATSVKVSWAHPKADVPTNLTRSNMQPGSMFPVGETTDVSYSFFDEETELNVICKFSVTVRRESQKCYLWGDAHYKTFDGRHHDFQGNCMYSLVKPCSTEDVPYFHLLGEVMHYGPRVEKGGSLREVRLVYNGNSFTVSKNDIVMLNDIRIALPLIDYDGVTIRYSSPNVIISTDFGLKVKYDGRRYVEVHMTSISGVCGLCGTNDGDPSNDFTKPNGEVVTDVLEYGNSWATLPCVDIFEEVDKCPDRTSEAALFALDLCNVIKDPDGPFRDCHAYYLPYYAHQACVVDICVSYPSSDKLCDSIARYASLCRQVGRLARNWREEVLDCAMNCPAPSEYNFCGSSCQPSCAEKSGLSTDCPWPCEETCECPEGTVLSGKQCVRPEECGCFLNSGVYLMNGQSWVSNDCSATCVCEDGQLNCVNQSCSTEAECVFRNSRRMCQCISGYHGDGYACVADLAACKIWGDPHHLTFDGKQHNFQGKCDYTLVKLCTTRVDLVDFHLIVDNKEVRRGSYATMMQSMTLQYRDHEYTLKRGGKIFLDGVKLTLPLRAHKGVTIMHEPPNIVLETEFGMVIRHNKKSMADIYLPSPFTGAVCGLCGNFDGNKRNEFITPAGKKVKKVVAFGNSWAVQSEEECAPAKGTGENPCDADETVMNEVLQLCNVLASNSDEFSDCKSIVPTEIFYEACKFDLCMSLPGTEILCESIEEYAAVCVEMGGNPGSWRQNVPGCEFDCPEGTEYTPCGTSCPPTCGMEKRMAGCETCIEACLCPDGLQLDGDKCIEPRECGCTMDNGIYLSNGESYFPDDCSSNCTCIDAELFCSEEICSQFANCSIMDGIRECRCKNGYFGDGYDCEEPMPGVLPPPDLFLIGIIIDDCPDDIVATLEQCNPVIGIEWIEPSVNSSTPGNAYLVSQSAEPGHLMGVGTTTVTYLYRHEDNVDLENSCSFNITVLPDPNYSAEVCSCITADGDTLWVGDSYVTDGCIEHCSCQEGGTIFCEEYGCDAALSVCEVRDGTQGCFCPEGFFLEEMECHKDKCPEGYAAFMESCYKFIPDKKTFKKAQEFCTVDGGNLAVITSEKENDFVANLVGPSTVAWIGAQTTNSEAISTYETEEAFSYTFISQRPLPEGLSRVEFGVSAEKDARIGLSPESKVVDNMWEIVIGGTNNSVTSLRTCKGCHAKVVVDTINVLSPDGEVCFYIKIAGKSVSFGMVGMKPFFTFVDRSSSGPSLRYIGVASGFEAPATWNFYEHFTWITGEPWTYENWGKNDPNSYRDHKSCSLINFPCEGAWGDFCCNLYRSFVCEM